MGNSSSLEDTTKITDLGHGYSKSTHTVHYRRYKLPVAISPSFKALEDGYAADAHTVFYKGRHLKMASSSSFKTLGDGYAADAHTVFYKGRTLDMSTVKLKYLGRGYIKNTWKVVHNGELLEGVDPKTFSIMTESHRVKSNKKR